MFDHWEVRDVIIGVALFLMSLLLTSSVMVALLVNLPTDHLVRPPISQRPRGALGWARKIGKNLLGVVMIIAGVLMLPPGIPGQGLLTLFAGLLLVDFPGKHRFERKLMMRPALNKAVNRIRNRFGRPALLLPEPADRGSADGGD